eukprot:564706-Amphidinium_carterae.1
MHFILTLTAVQRTPMITGETRLTLPTPTTTWKTRPTTLRALMLHQFTNDTSTWEEDLTWKQEDLEEESRERDEVASVSPEDVRQLPRPSVVNPQPPPWATPQPEVEEEEEEEEEMQSVDFNATECEVV